MIKTFKEYKSVNESTNPLYKMIIANICSYIQETAQIRNGLQAERHNALDFAQILSIGLAKDYRSILNDIFDYQKFNLSTNESINKEDALTELSIEILKKEIESCENKLNDKVKLKHSIKYEKTQLNKSLKSDFDKFIEILQKIVDKFYWNKYEVNSYEPFNLDNFEFALERNKSTLNSLKKLMKFCEI